MVLSGMVHLALWFCRFEVLILPVSGCDIVCLRFWNRPYHVLKWCFSCDEKVALNVMLVSTRLYKTFIFRLYPSKRESACKFSFIFLGRTENSNWKNAGYWKSVTHPFEFPLCWRQQRRYGIDAAVFYYYQSPLNIGMTTSYVILRWFINRNLSSLSSTGNLVERKIYLVRELYALVPNHIFANKVV